MSEHTYEIRVANAPNADGLFVAEFYKNGSYIGLRAHEDRVEAISRALAWIDDDRDITYETISA